MRGQNGKQNTSYRDRPINELQNELKRLKQKEKVYLKLSSKVKDLQEKSKKIKHATDDITSQQYENQQIERLKQDIDKTLADIKKIDEDNKIIKEQTKNLENQLKGLEDIHNNLCSENKLKRQRIQLKGEQLDQKQNQLESLTQKRNCNEIVIEELKIQISKLHDQEEELRGQLERLTLQRRQEEKQKERLRNFVAQLKREIADRQSDSKDYRYKISQIKEAGYIIKQELITLIKLEQKLKSELQKALISYQNTITLETHSKNKLKLLQDELFIAEEDIKILTDEYIRESQTLKEQEIKNHNLNNEIDQLAKQIFGVWQNVKELIEIDEPQNGQIKNKAYRIWAEVQQILLK